MQTDGNDRNKPRTAADDSAIASSTKLFQSAHEPDSATTSRPAVSVASLVNEASEVITNSTGKTVEVPLSQNKLSAGDHLIELHDGREFEIHIPNTSGDKSLPVMFVISPSVDATNGFNAKNFGTETGMNQQSDQNGFVAVYPLPKDHLLGTYSTQKSFAWNAEGAGIDEKDLKFAGYSDVDFIKSITSLLPKLANVDSTHKNWGAIAFSQGGMFLNELVHEIPDLFPSVGLVGTTMETNHDYSTAQGNAKNVMIVNLRADKSTLPFPGLSNGRWKYDLQKLASDIVPPEVTKWIAEHTSSLGGIDNRKQDPNLQEQQYLSNLQALGSVSSSSVTLDTPKASTNKDIETIIKPRNHDSPDGLYIYDLPNAQHAYPGPERGARTNSTPKYTEFDTTEQFVKLFDNYNATTTAR